MQNSGISRRARTRKRKIYLFLALMLVLISPWCTIVFSRVYASACTCTYLTSVNQVKDPYNLAVVICVVTQNDFKGKF